MKIGFFSVFFYRTPPSWNQIQILGYSYVRSLSTEYTVDTSEHAPTLVPFEGKVGKVPFGVCGDSNLEIKREKVQIKDFKYGYSEQCGFS